MRELQSRQLGDVAHQGVVAEISPLAPWSEDDLLDALQSAQGPAAAGARWRAGPSQPGACLRTADACGALAVIVPKDRAAQLTATVRKVAAGAAETTPVVAVTNLVRTLKLLKEAGLWIVGADAQAPSCPGGRSEGRHRAGAGRRRRGAAPADQADCDWMVRLPQLGAVESLNVSVAAGMLLYEAVAAHGAAPAPRAASARVSDIGARRHQPGRFGACSHAPVGPQRRLRQALPGWRPDPVVYHSRPLQDCAGRADAMISLPHRAASRRAAPKSVRRNS